MTRPTSPTTPTPISTGPSSEPLRVSVLIGTWNNAATLRRAIDSILSQTLTELEVLVVDDGSTDATPEVLAGVEDPRVHHVALEHMGIARSLNVGLRAARAPLAAILDADDVALPERMAHQVALLERRPEVAMVGCQMREVDEAGRPLTRRLPFASGDLDRILFRFNPIPGTSAALRIAPVLALGGFDARYRWAPDYDLVLRLAERHVVANLAEELALRTLGTTNAGAVHERAQIAESVRARASALRRRRSVRGVGGLVRPAASYALPLRFKRTLRRRRGQAP